MTTASNSERLQKVPPVKNRIRETERIEREGGGGGGGAERTKEEEENKRKKQTSHRENGDLTSWQIEMARQNWQRDRK